MPAESCWAVARVRHAARGRGVSVSYPPSSSEILPPSGVVLRTNRHGNAGLGEDVERWAGNKARTEHKHLAR